MSFTPKLNKPQLYAMATFCKIKGRSTMNKTELLKTIQERYLTRKYLPIWKRKATYKRMNIPPPPNQPLPPIPKKKNKKKRWSKARKNAAKKERQKRELKEDDIPVEMREWNKEVMVWLNDKYLIEQSNLGLDIILAKGKDINYACRFLKKYQAQYITTFKETGKRMSFMDCVNYVSKLGQPTRVRVSKAAKDLPVIIPI